MLTITILLAAAIKLHAQTPVGSWSDHLVYNTAIAVCAGTSEVYASTGSSVLVFNREYEELRKMSRINGLDRKSVV